MFSQFWANFTVLDAVIAVMIGWTCCSGFRKGIFVEIFKIAALGCAVFIGLHFYLRFSAFLDGLLGVLRPVSRVLSYVLLTGACIGIFRIFRDGVMVLLKQDDLKTSSRWIGAVLGCARGILLASLLLVGSLIVDHIKVTHVVRQSFSSRFLLRPGPEIYSAVFRFVVDPVFPGETQNTSIVTLARQNSIRPD